MFNLSRRSSHLNRSMRSAVLVLGLTASVWAGAQNISDVPLAVKNNVPPNLMFMIDTSGSMNHIVPDAPFDAGTLYSSLACLLAGTVPTNNTVTISVSGGVPRFTQNGTTYRHATVSGSNQRCFNPTSVYTAFLNQDDISGTGTAAQYTGNYLNWYFGNFGGPITGWGLRKPLTGGGTVSSRMDTAKTSAAAVVNDLPTSVSGSTLPAVRIGLSTYNGGTGGRLRSGMADLRAATATGATTKAAFNTIISGLDAGGVTPLASTLADIGRYFATGYSGNITDANGNTVNIDTFFRMSGDAGNRNACLNGANCSTGTAPVTAWCQRSFTFMMTDGLARGDIAFENNQYLRDYDRDCSGANSSSCVSNGATNAYDKKNGRIYEPGGSDYLDDVAKALFDIDLRPDLTASTGQAKKNNMITYTIGFADLQVQNDPLLINTAAQGGGQFLTAENEASLTRAFQGALTDAFAKDAASSAVSVANAQLTVNNIGYASSYNSGSWYGDLEAFSLDTTTGLPIGAAEWSAQARLDALGAGGRKIFSFNGTTGSAFTAANYATLDATAPGPGLVNYVRGIRTGEGTTFRTRQHLLGDIVNSEPVVVTYAGDVPILFQAANDGMLHAFDGRVDATIATRGQELWAYVPRLIHSKLPILATDPYTHRYFVDGTPASAEITGAGAMTRILVGGLGKGGAGYYALDITTYLAGTEALAAAKVKWEIKPTNMGYSFGTPLIVNTAAGWRVVVTSGYGNGTNAELGNGNGQGYVWVLNPATGAVVKTFGTGVGSAANPSGLVHLGKLANTTPDSVVRYVYGGDLFGNVWRFDLDAADGSAPAKIAVLTDGSGITQPVTTAPTVGPVTGSTTKFYVYVGTGRYLADEDVPGNAGATAAATQRQTMYGVIDDTLVGAPTLPNIRGTNGATCPAGGGTSNFVCQSTTFVGTAGLLTGSYTATANAVDLVSKRGWYLDLPADIRLTNGRITGNSALTTTGTLAFVANVPTNVTCDPGGRSYFFAINASTGGAVSRVVGGNTYYDAGSFLAYALASRPVIVQTGSGRRALIRLSDKSIGNPIVPEPTNENAPWRRIYWRSLN